MTNIFPSGHGICNTDKLTGPEKDWVYALELLPGGMVRVCCVETGGEIGEYHRSNFDACAAPDAVDPVKVRTQHTISHPECPCRVKAFNADGMVAFYNEDYHVVDLDDKELEALQRIIERARLELKKDD